MTRPSAPSSVTDETARAQDTGPLRGIAVGIKDIIDTARFSDRDGLQRSTADIARVPTRRS